MKGSLTKNPAKYTLFLKHTKVKFIIVQFRVPEIQRKQQAQFLSVSCKHKHSTFFFSNTSFAPDKISPSSILQEHGMWSRCSREYGQIQRKISCIDRPEVTWRPPRFLRKISRIKPCCCRQITSAKFSLAPKYEVLSFSRKLCWKRSLSWSNYITLILASGTHK